MDWFIALFIKHQMQSDVYLEVLSSAPPYASVLDVYHDQSCLISSWRRDRCVGNACGLSAVVQSVSQADHRPTRLVKHELTKFLVADKSYMSYPDSQHIVKSVASLSW